MTKQQFLSPRRACSLLSFVALCCGACSQSPDNPQTATSNDAFTLEVVDRAKFDKVLKNHRGKVVLVDYWSTSCMPCVEKLPAVLALEKELGNRGLRVITLGMDDADVSAEIGDFLQGKGAAGLHLISKFGSSPQSFDEFEIDLVPEYRLYNRDGELVETFVETGPDSPKIEVSKIKAAIERLL